MLPANQSSHSPAGSRYRLQATAISLAPHKPFSVCRYQFAMVISKVTIGGECEKGIVECSVTCTRLDALIRANHKRDFKIGGQLRKTLRFLPGNGWAILPKSGEYV